MTGLEFLRAPGTTAEQIAGIVAEHCPPVTPEHCDKLSCRDCWLAWLTTGESETPRSTSVLLPEGEGAPEKQVPRYEKAVPPREYAAMLLMKADTAAVLLLPLGLYMIFTEHYILYP